MLGKLCEAVPNPQSYLNIAHANDIIKTFAAKGGVLAKVTFISYMHVNLMED